jgi:Protein of unknown function (DUF4240)
MTDEAQFWKIIDDSRQRARERERPLNQDFITVQEQTLADILRQLTPEAIVGFHDRFWDYHSLAYRWDLWAAAYWLHGGCGDDGFIDFRSCLISLGKELFFQILKDPDVLADIVDRPDIPYMQAEGFQYVASKVYEDKTGKSIWQTQRDDDGPKEPVGERIEEDNAEVMRKHFPKLVARFPNMGD